MSDQIQKLDINLLQPNPFQPRGLMDKSEIKNLAQSIKAHGILEPLVVAHTPAGYQIIAGERRWRAAKLANLTLVPVIIKQTTPKGMLEMALIENVQRVNLHALERAKAFRQLQTDFGYGTREISRRIGKSESYVSNSLRLLELPDAVADGLAGGLISEGHARALLGLKEKALMIEVYKRVLRENASVRRTEELVRLYKGKSTKQPQTTRTETYQVDDRIIRHWQKALEAHLASKSKIKLHRSQKQTRVTITLYGDPKQTQKDLETIIKLSQK